MYHENLQIRFSERGRQSTGYCEFFEKWVFIRYNGEFYEKQGTIVNNWLYLITSSLQKDYKNINFLSTI